MQESPRTRRLSPQDIEMEENEAENKSCRLRFVLTFQNFYQDHKKQTAENQMEGDNLRQQFCDDNWRQ